MSQHGVHARLGPCCRRDPARSKTGVEKGFKIVAVVDASCDRFDQQSLDEHHRLSFVPECPGESIWMVGTKSPRLRVDELLTTLALELGHLLRGDL